ncbi:hypothetical protein ACROYT_G026086 [Oculina patagonica]
MTGVCHSDLEAPQRVFRYPCFRNFNSAISIDVIRMKSYLDSLFDPACVESLFTNVPIEDAVKAALRKLENDPGLADRTNLTATQIADLLNFVLRSTYFQYNGSIYEQKDGAAMGSPVSAVIANIFMEDFEERAIASAIYKPTEQGVRTVFKSDTTLRSYLVRPKDALEPGKQEGVVYKIPCECGKVYIGETGRAMQDRIKEHDRDIRLAHTQNSAVSPKRLYFVNNK